MSPTKRDALSIYLSKEALALLKKLKYPCSEDLLASATPVDREGFELTGGGSPSRPWPASSQATRTTRAPGGRPISSATSPRRSRAP